MYEIFEKLCFQKGVTPYRVCKETGLTTATISNWKAGRYVPKSDKMQKIADYFGVSLNYLMGNSFIKKMGFALQEERIDLNLTQQEVAEKAGISIADLEAYETQNEPIREDIFNDIASALGTSYIELLVKYDMYDEYITFPFNGDSAEYDAFKKTQAIDTINENLPDSFARNNVERRLLMLCRKADDATPAEKDAILNQFEATIDMYLRAKGIIKE